MPVPNPFIDTRATALPYAYGGARVTGILREHPHYFFVEEKLGFEPAGEGEHVFLWIEKSGVNTQFIADRLVTLAGVRKQQVSYSGMKDRHAVTRQWFSVHLPAKPTIDWTVLNNDNVTVLTSTYHRKKLRRGTHKGNFFRIKLTGLNGDLCDLECRLNTVKRRGVPNYFGEQRFGRGGANLHHAQGWFAGKYTPKRHQRGVYLSAARAFIFNQVLAKRVNEQSWDTLYSGELCMLNGTHSVFIAEDKDDLSERVLSADIHPTGPLFGNKRAESSMGCQSIAALEQQVFDELPTLINGLRNADLKQERRALRMIPADFSWLIDQDSIELSFFLQSGCFATALVRELVSYQVHKNAAVIAGVMGE